MSFLKLSVFHHFWPLKPLHSDPVVLSWNPRSSIFLWNLRSTLQAILGPRLEKTKIPFPFNFPVTVKCDCTIFSTQTKFPHMKKWIIWINFFSQKCSIWFPGQYFTGFEATIKLAIGWSCETHWWAFISSLQRRSIWN